MAYTFFMDGMQLPVPPSKFQLKIKNQNKTINLINDGEVNVLKEAGLSELSADICIPQVKYPYAQYPDGFKPAAFYLEKLKQLKAGKQPFQFICSRVAQDGGLLFDTDMTVSLEDYTVSESANDGPDLLVTVSMKQYRPYGTKTVEVNNASGMPIAAASGERPAQSAPQTKAYTVVKGDTLWNIAKKHLGDGSRYMEIYELNTDKIKNPNLINIGQVLVLP